MQQVLTFIEGAISIFEVAIIIRIFLSWFSGAHYGKAFELLSTITDPYLNWFRRFSFLRVGAFDFSPIAALGVLSIVRGAIGMLSRYGMIRVGIILTMLLSLVWSAVSFLFGFCAIIVGLRVIAYITNRDVYGSFWQIVDNASRPILYRTNRLMFNRRSISYRTSLFASLALFAVALVAGHFLIQILKVLLLSLPF
ncbi:putative YggT family protein [Pillotina sp. SPG140]|jgi:YggT family protein